MLIGVWCGDLVRCEHVPAAPGSPGLRAQSWWLSVATQSLDSPATAFSLQTNSPALYKFQTGVRMSEALSSINKDENMSIFLENPDHFILPVWIKKPKQNKLYSHSS